MPPIVTIAPLDHIVPQAQNLNKHTARGMAALEDSIKTDGWVGAITVAADGTAFDGSARVEVGVAGGFGDALVVHTDGSQPLLHIRDDIPTATHPRAVRLGAAANRIAQVNLDWDTELIAALIADTPDLLAGLWTDTEQADLLGTVPDVLFQEYDETAADGVKYAVCPACGHKFPA